MGIGRKPKEIYFIVNEDSGCITQTSHKLNSDGYFRKRVDGKLVMYHRYVWEKANGEIPEGHEVDHVCKNRGCCNLEHLQLLSSTEHRAKDNAERYSERHKKAKTYWLEDTRRTGRDLSAKFGVTDSCGYRWIREWKQERAETIP